MFQGALSPQLCLHTVDREADLGDTADIKSFFNTCVPRPEAALTVSGRFLFPLPCAIRSYRAQGLLSGNGRSSVRPTEQLPGRELVASQGV